MMNMLGDSPHPFKKARTLPNNNNNNNSVMSTTEELVTEEEEPPGAVATLVVVNTTSNDDHPDESASPIPPHPEDSNPWWDAVVLEIRASSDEQTKQQLEQFVQGMQQRQAATQRLHAVFETVIQQGLLQQQLEPAADNNNDNNNEASRFVFAGVAMAYHDMSDRLADQSCDLQQLLVQNHARRDRMQQQVEQQQAAWQQHTQQLVQRIQNNLPENAPGAAAAAMDTEEQQLSLSQPNAHDPPPTDVTELLLLLPDHDHNVQVFLQGTDRWHAAQDRFGASMETLHHQLRQQVQLLVVQTVLDAAYTFHQTGQEQQDEIQHLIADNFKRRAYLEESIGQAALQQQSMFGKLLARLTGFTQPQQS